MGKEARLKPSPASAPEVPGAPVTRKNAHNASCAGLRARIRHALDFDRVPKIRFVDRQIAIHQEHHSRQQSRVVISNKLQAVLNQIETIAKSEHWSQRELASKLGLPESTLRKIKRAPAMPEVWVPKLQAAASRLTPS